jgi:hypothetical protein
MENIKHTKPSNSTPYDLGNSCKVIKSTVITIQTPQNKSISTPYDLNKSGFRGYKL